MSGLTPPMARLMNSNDLARERLSAMRKCAQEAEALGINDTFVLIAEELVNMAGANEDDVMTLSKAYNRNNEYRRSLAIMEHHGLLSVKRNSILCDFMKPSDGCAAKLAISPDVASSFHAVFLAAQNLFALKQFEECILLLEMFLCIDENLQSTNVAVSRYRMVVLPQSSCINLISELYAILGQCYDKIDHRVKAVRALIISVKVDVANLKSITYLVQNYLINGEEKRNIFDSLSFDGMECFKSIYRKLLDREDSNISVREHPDNETQMSAVELVRKAETMMDVHRQPEEAYRLARHAYSIDPFSNRCLLVYVYAMTELTLKTELFYIGHELVNSFPLNAISWYAVGCYYWCCKKYDKAQQFLVKATLLDKRFPQALIVLGHVMSAKEESEQAISAFRSAGKLMPGDHRPLVLAAKELIRTNYVSLALHMLSMAANFAPADPIVLNELGVVHFRLNRMDEALHYLSKAVEFTGKCSKVGSKEIYSNYATVLRKCKRYEEARMWCEKSLVVDPNDFNTQCSLGLILMIQQRFSDAIAVLHQALAQNPASTVGGELLNSAISDASFFEVDAPLETLDDYLVNMQNSREDQAMSLIDCSHDSVDCSHLSSGVHSYSRVVGSLGDFGDDVEMDMSQSRSASN